MEGNRSRPPTVVPLTRNLLEQIFTQQQSRAPPFLAGQLPGPRAQTVGAGQTMAINNIMPAHSGATAVNLTELGERNNEGQGSRTAISVQVLNNNASNAPKPGPSRAVTVSQPPVVRYTYKGQSDQSQQEECIYSHIFTMCPADLSRSMDYVYG